MSAKASELLRALGSERTPDWDGSWLDLDGTWINMNLVKSAHALLPLIADVVEAAEDFGSVDWHALKYLTDPLQDWRALHVEDVEQLIESRKRAQAALTALTEALAHDMPSDRR